jgi:hypothetical protein
MTKKLLNLWKKYNKSTKRKGYIVKIVYYSEGNGYALSNHESDAWLFDFDSNTHLEKILNKED